MSELMNERVPPGLRPAIGKGSSTGALTPALGGRPFGLCLTEEAKEYQRQWINSKGGGQWRVCVSAGFFQRIQSQFSSLCLAAIEFTRSQRL